MTPSDSAALTAALAPMTPLPAPAPKPLDWGFELDLDEARDARLDAGRERFDAEGYFGTRNYR